MRLWRNNRIDQEYELSTEEIVAGFLTSKWNHFELPLDRLLRSYLTANADEGGLASVFEEADYPAVYEAVWDARHLPAVTEETVVAHVEERHGGNDDAPEGETPAELVRWHDSMHASGDLIHAHQYRRPS